MAYEVVALSTLLTKYDSQNIRKVFDSFESPDKDIEIFLKEKAISFEKVGISRSTLIFSDYKGQLVLVGFFSISSKPLSIGKKNWKKLSNTVKRKLAPMGYKSEIENYIISSILLGQISKNFKYKSLNLISGSDLLSLAYENIKKVWEYSGGNVLYLEALNEPHIREFYINNGFSQILVKNGENTKNHTIPYETVNGYHLYIKKLSDI